MGQLGILKASPGAALSPSPAPQQAAPPTSSARLALLVRVGALLPEETSPRGSTDRKALWELALAGTTWPFIDLEGLERTSEGASSTLARTIEDALGAGASLTAMRLDARAPQSNEGEERSPGPGTLLELERRFGVAPPASPAEIAALKALQRSLQGKAGDSSDYTTGEERADAVPRIDARHLSRLTPGRVVVFVEAATSSAPEALATRNANLARLQETVGADGTLLVLNVPAEGDGSLVARGPDVREARVLATRRPWKAAAALLTHAAGRPVSGPDREAATAWLEGTTR